MSGVGSSGRAGDAPRWRSAFRRSRRSLTAGGPTVVVLLLELASLGQVPNVPVHMVLALAAAVSLLWRHRAPWLVLAVTGMAPAGQVVLLGSPQTNTVLAQWVATAAVVAVLPWPRSLLAPAGMVLLTTGVSLVARPAGGVPDFLINVISAAVAWSFGDAQARRAAARASTAAQLATLQASSELRTRYEALSERLRISDETGRLLGATLDAVLAQVRAARTTLGSEAGLRHLAAVEQEGRRALAHLDRYLAWLRLPQPPVAQPAAPVGLPTRGPWWSTRTAKVAVATGPVALLLPLAIWEYPDLVASGRSGVTTALTVLQVLPLLGRARWPFAVTVGVAVALLLQLALGHPVHNATLALPLALHSLTERDGRHRTGPLAAGLAGALGAAALGVDAAYGAGFVLILATVCAVAVYTGDAARQLRQQDDQLQVELTRTALDDQLRIRAAIGQERLLAAQDLHDSVGHVLSLVTLQAGGARLAAAVSPERAAPALDAIERAALTALSELDVSVREAPPDAGLRVRTLADLRQLGDQVRAAGVTVVLRTDGTSALPAVLQATAFRVVQEALTNAVKHAPGSTAVVTVVGTQDVLRLVVRTTAGRADGGTAAVPSGRRGLQGMRERVALFGGELLAGPQPGGGFLVRVTLPVPGVDPSAAPAPPQQRAGEGAASPLPGT